MSNINLAAYDKLSTAFAYAQQIKGSADARGANSVVRLQGGGIGIAAARGRGRAGSAPSGGGTRPPARRRARASRASEAPPPGVR